MTSSHGCKLTIILSNPIYKQEQFHYAQITKMDDIIWTTMHSALCNGTPQSLRAVFISVPSNERGHFYSSRQDNIVNPAVIVGRYPGHRLVDRRPIHSLLCWTAGYLAGAAPLCHFLSVVTDSMKARWVKDGNHQNNSMPFNYRQWPKTSNVRT